MGTKLLLKHSGINTDFDFGSVSAVNDSSGLITPYKSFGGYWWWYAFRTSMFGGQTPTFKINKSDYFQTASTEYRYGCYSTSLDSDTWIDFGTPTVGATYIEFTPSSPLPSGVLYFSHMPIYPFSRTQRKMTGWLAHSYVSDTASSTNGILGNTTERTCSLDGKLIPALPFYGFKISKTSGNTKNHAILSGGLHPGEAIGRFMFEGGLDWLLGGSAEAETLLDWFDFYVYPCLCPDGIYAGLFRSSPQNLTLDYNRYWHTTGSLDGIDIFKSAMVADTGGAVEVGMDFHCSNNSTYNSGQNYANAYGSTAGDHPAYLAIMKTLDSANFGLVNFTDNGTLIKFWHDTLMSGTLSLCMHPEISGRLEYSVAEIKTYGENNLKAIYQLLVAGSFPNHPV